MMRILHTSDWHLGKHLENISRIEEQREFIDELCDICEQESIDIVLIAGDIFDTYTPSAAAEELFYDAVDRLSDKGRRAVIVIAGNHDSPERLCAASPLAYKNGVIILGYPNSDAGEYPTIGNNIKVVDSGSGWLELKTGNCAHHAVIIALPYPSESRLEQVLCHETDEEKQQKAYSDKITDVLTQLSEKFRQDTVNLIVSHLFLNGGKECDSERTLQVGGAMTVNTQKLPTNAQYIALGHLHRPQRIKSAPAPTVYSGSPLAYSFSEAGQAKAVFVVDAVPGNEADIKEIFLNSGKPLVRWIAEQGIEQAMAWCKEGKDKNAWIDLEIHTDRIITSEEQKELREQNSGIMNIRPVIISEDREIETFQDRETKKIDELFKEYYHYKTGTEISEELINTFLDILNDEESAEDEQDTSTDTGILSAPSSSLPGKYSGGDGIETKIS
ncbi:exonuclease SbcCD subunit D C-terminal domain-containing protein [Petroclostridium sp. X23]|uniref:metallophosphoesterase family protein n=1 Tax=Petroclostridium sp. X23 TaxID=3045146 RepID=UPI0024AD9AC1|nr:exonuclease SbcCD subunit D C-terminal domain-containing protein [Petroclostridium sp. X23]WHH57449.1 exonuclease SbcCD subunit D C-terminal domain-containing protein [Petroclostridium sp. X23]